ncbi:MAG: type II secretion system GspH family protein [Planctomycetes bacterium]|nr:type II secretion system GspH family protein [Planctomycetota bacterium]
MKTRYKFLFAGCNEAGFSLLELIVATGIMVLLAGAAIPSFSAIADRTKKSETLEELNELKSAVENYFQDVGALPSDLDELEENSDGVSDWAGPYMNAFLSETSSANAAISQDAWNNNYTLNTSGISGLEILSSGKDGSSGTSDDLSVDVDVTFLRRDSTLQELAILNTSIYAYNTVYLASAPLPADWSQILATLKSSGFLPLSATDLNTDGWGDDYEPDPAGVSPVVLVTSPNL